MTRKDRTQGATPSYLEKSIQQLEGEDWGEPDYDTWAVQASHVLRRIPLRLLSDEGLRLALDERNGLPWVFELALQRLEENPLRFGEYYSGDVLVSALRAAGEALPRQTDFTPRLRAVIERAEQDLAAISELESGLVREAIERFRANGHGAV